MAFLNIIGYLPLSYIIAIASILWITIAIQDYNICLFFRLMQFVDIGGMDAPLEILWDMSEVQNMLVRLFFPKLLF